MSINSVKNLFEPSPSNSPPNSCLTSTTKTINKYSTIFPNNNNNLLISQTTNNNYNNNINLNSKIISNNNNNNKENLLQITPEQ